MLHEELQKLMGDHKQGYRNLVDAEESELKSRQIEACNAEIIHVSEEVKALSTSLEEKEVTTAQLQSEIQQVTSSQLSEFIKQRTQIAELEHKLQEAEEQKQKEELERDTRVQGTKARENFKAQLHVQFGKL